MSDIKTERAELFYANWSNEALLIRLNIFEQSVKQSMLIPKKTPSIRESIERDENQARILYAILETRL